MRRQQKIREQKKWEGRCFLLIIAALSLLKLWLVQGLVIHPLPSAMCDDVLLRDWATSIAGGEWMGPFSCYTFAKEVGFSIYLAITYRLQLPYILTTNLLYMAGALALLYAVSHVMKKKWALCLIYAAILFHPIMTSLDTGQRVYRNGFAVALTLWVFGSLLNLYFEIGKPLYQSLPWAVLAAGSLGALWNTKSDTVWLLPFSVVVLLVAAALVLKKQKGWKAALPRLALLALPLLGIIFVSKFIAIMNAGAYGAPHIAYYKPAMSILMNTETEGRTANISLPAKAFQELCAYSPTLATAQKEIEAQLKAYDQYDRQKGDGEVEDGWIGWALIEGIAEAGYYGSCQEANAFYQDVYEELQAAVEAGQIKIRPRSFLETFHLSTAEEGKELFSAIGQIWGYVASHCDLEAQVKAIPREKNELGGCRIFEVVTHDKACYGGDFDYCCSLGWILFSEYDLGELQVFVEDAQGNRLQKVRFQESEDIGRLYPDIKGSDRCRFFVKWDSQSSEEDIPYWLAAYADGRQVAKARMDELGMHELEEKSGFGAIDLFISPYRHQKAYEDAQKSVKRCNIPVFGYLAFGYPLALAGAAAYLAFTVLSVMEWRRKEYGELNAWLVITGIHLSLLLLFAGIAVTHLQKCPAITSMYLSASYPLFTLAALLSIFKCAEGISKAARQAVRNKNRRPGK